MPVYKYRSVEEWQKAKDDLWLACDDPRLSQRIRRMWAQWSARVELNVPRGVRKYRSVEEMNADRERWEDERVARLRK